MKFNKMRKLRDIPLKSKLTVITMITSCSALLLACIAFVSFGSVDYYNSLVDELRNKADIIGYNSSAALSFNDHGSAEGLLSSFGADHDIVAVALYDNEGKVFAKYSSDASLVIPPVEHDSHRVSRKGLELFREIHLEDEQIGTVYIRHSADEFWRQLLRYAVVMTLVMAGASAMAFLLSRRLREVISRPISQLASVVQEVTSRKDYSARAVKQSNDELGQLIDGFNEMLEQIQARDIALQSARDDLEKRVAERTQELEDIHKQLLQASRESGMAEIATNVLHNVGNVLNSVNISTGVLAENMKRSKASSLGLVVALLQEHAADLGEFIASDSKGRLVPTHLAQLSEHLTSEREGNLRELEALRQNVEHIKEIVAMQQDYARVGGLKEVIDVVNLVEDSMRMNEGGLSRHGVEVIREFNDVPLINVEKHKILQILVNLVRNAKHACDGSKRTDKKMTVRVANGEGLIKISVLDNGIGIPPENLTRIFNHGFTTWKDGHGFGLHSGALAAKEMGGSLTVHSDGFGRGAAFTLELPCEPNKQPNKSAV